MIGKLAALTVGVAILTAAPAQADDVQGYLDALHERGISASSGDGALVAAGMYVCNLLDAGMAPLAVAMKVYRETDVTIDHGDAGFIVGTAIAGLCPEHIEAAMA